MQSEECGAEFAPQALGNKLRLFLLPLAAAAAVAKAATPATTAKARATTVAVVATVAGVVARAAAARPSRLLTCSVSLLALCDRKPRSAHFSIESCARPCALISSSPADCACTVFHSASCSLAARRYSYFPTYDGQAMHPCFEHQPLFHVRWARCAVQAVFGGRPPCLPFPREASVAAT